MKRRFRLTFLWLVTAGAGCAQSLLNYTNPLDTAGRGLSLESLSLYSAYSSRTVPPGGAVTDALGADTSVGGMASFGWRRPRANSGFNFHYGVSYNGRIVYSEWNAWNHDLSLSGYRKLGRKWSASLSLAATATNLDQMLFTPQVLGSLAAIPASMDELSQALLSGQLGNDQFASLLTGAPILQSPAMSVIYGTRMFNTSLNAGLDYQASARLSFRFSGGASRAQYMEGSWDQKRGLLPRSTSANIGAGMTYSLSPRTNFQLDAGSTRSFSNFQDAYNTTVRAGFGRRLSRRWFGQGYAGAGFIKALRSIGQLPSGLQYDGGTSLAYKTVEHSFMLSASRSISDSFGLGLAYVASLGGGWQWSRPGRSWAVSAGVSYQKMGGGSFLNLQGWSSNASFARSLNRNTRLQFTYSYLSSSVTRSINPGSLDIHGVRLSFIWTPQRAR